MQRKDPVPSGPGIDSTKFIARYNDSTVRPASYARGRATVCKIFSRPSQDAMRFVAFPILLTNCGWSAPKDREPLDFQPAQLCARWQGADLKSAPLPRSDAGRVLHGEVRFHEVRPKLDTSSCARLMAWNFNSSSPTGGRPPATNCGAGKY